MHVPLDFTVKHKQKTTKTASESVVNLRTTAKGSACLNHHLFTLFMVFREAAVLLQLTHFCSEFPSSSQPLPHVGKVEMSPSDCTAQWEPTRSFHPSPSRGD